MKASIIVPIYNVEEYIKDCLDSIYDGGLTDFEVICIDDKGKDNSIKIVKEYMVEKDIKNLRIIEHPKNMGLSEARNTGIKASKGEYIVFVDSDDMVLSSNLNELIDYAKKNKLDIAEGEIEEVYETGLRISSDYATLREDTDILKGTDYFSLVCKKSEYIPMVWSRVYKTKYIKDKYTFKTGLKFEDEEYTPRVLIGAKRVKYINKKIYVYRRRNNSITTNMVKDTAWIQHYIRIIEAFTEFSKSIKDKETYKFLIERRDNLVLSLIKNPLSYNASKKVLDDTIKIIKEKRIYKLPLKNSNLIIKAQGLLMRFPKIFIILYKMRGKV